MSITLAWYLPFAKDLYEWFLVGYYNSQDYQNPIAPFKENFKIIYDSWNSLFWLFSILILGAFLGKKKLKDYHEVLILGSVIFFIYILLFLTKSAGITPMRRIIPGMTLFLAGLLIFSSIGQNQFYKKLHHIVLVVFSLLVFANLFYSFNSIWNNTTLNEYQKITKKWLNISWHHQVEYNVYNKPDYNFVNALTGMVIKNKIENTNIRVVQFSDWPPDVTLGIDLAQIRLKIPYTLFTWIKFTDEWTKVSDLKKHQIHYIVIDTFPEWSDEELQKRSGFSFFIGP